MQFKISRWFVAVFLVGALLFAGCSPNGTATSPNAGATSATETVGQATPSPTAEATAEPTLPQLTGEATVEMVVKGSPITIQVNGNEAPITAGNFVDLVNRGVYNGLMFHRVVREPQPFVVQGGDPQSGDPNFPVAQLGTGGFVDPATGAPRYIPLEIEPEGADTPVYSQVLGGNQTPKLRHTRGAVAMARSQFPDSASSQFYFALADLDFLNGSYAVFGNVTNGMEVVDAIQQGDRIDSARVVAGLENLQNGWA